MRWTKKFVDLKWSSRSRKLQWRRPIEIPHHVERVAHSEHRTPRSNEVKMEDLEDWKA